MKCSSDEDCNENASCIRNDYTEISYCKCNDGFEGNGLADNGECQKGISFSKSANSPKSSHMIAYYLQYFFKLNVSYYIC